MRQATRLCNVGRRIAAGCLAAVLAVSTMTGATPATALSLIRDAEIEATLQRMTTPILRAAGIRPDSVSLYIVNDPALNAFVAGGQNMFLHTGLLTELETPEQVIGVFVGEEDGMNQRNFLSQ